MAFEFPKPQDKYPVIYLKDTDDDLPDHVINNKMRYGEFKTLARGGKCLIQACRDYHLGRVVCYKSLLPEIRDDAYEQKRFLREARVTAMLQHPNTIPVYELSRDNNRHYYFTMKLVEGITLREILDQLKAADASTLKWYGLERLVGVLIQVGYALDYAANHGVVHRDIKPANILLGPFGEVLVLDWGLAKVWSMEDEKAPRMSMVNNPDRSLTAQGQLQATPLYMSPEQVTESKDIDQRTDIYSLGSVLYELLTLEHMAWGETLNEMLIHTRDVPPPPPREKAPDRHIPRELEAICLRCIEKAPDDRYQTPGELVAALEAWRPDTARAT